MNKENTKNISLGDDAFSEALLSGVSETLYLLQSPANAMYLQASITEYLKSEKNSFS